MKKNKSKDNVRALRMIECDRLGFQCGTEQLILSDIEKLLREYFTLDCKPNISMKLENDIIYINIEAYALSARSFKLLK